MSAPIIGKTLFNSYIRSQYSLVHMNEEKKLDSVPFFAYTPHPWVKRPIKTPLTRAKKLMDVSEHDWNGYFLLGGYNSIIDSQVTRFNPENPCYQAWIGSYMVYNNNPNNLFGFKNGEADIEELCEIAVGDQLSWLERYNDKKPLADIVSVKELPKKTLHKKARISLLLEMETHSDVNPNGSIDWFWNFAFGKPAQNTWDTVEPFHELTLGIYYTAWHDPEKRTSTIIYGCGIKNMETINGKKIDYWSSAKEETKKIINNFELRKKPRYLEYLPFGAISEELTKKQPKHALE